ncbi:cupin [Rhizobium sp. AAP43]|nr:cupin [Rhizobium sp. AAP43]
MPFKLLMAGMAAVLLAQPKRQAQADAPMIAANGNNLAFRAAPINPDWIIRGTPLARVGEHSTSGDEASSTAVWDCTAGEFRWYFGWDETVVIQDGEVNVTDADGNQRLLRAGDIAYFRAGTWSTWRIETYVRKVAFLRKPFPGPLASLYRLRNAMRGGGQKTL